MSISRLMQKAASAGGAGGLGPAVEDVFSTYLYEGNGSTQTITNGIDLDGEGGLVWIKQRTGIKWNVLTDSERGVGSTLFSNDNRAEESFSHVTALNSDGFGITSTEINESSNDHASWTFRKAPKFFDVVTYTGDGTSGRAISHNLGTTVGSIIVKRIDSSGAWSIYHRGMDATAPEDYALEFTTADRTGTANRWADTAPTSTTFTVGSDAEVNASGGTYVAYLFAHNDSDGGFGPAGDQDIIKCGSLTVSGQTTVDVNLGFEPQWVMLKRSSGNGDWYMFDTMRGMSVNGFAWLRANASDAEQTKSYQSVFPTATGFGFDPSSNANLADGDYIYIAIRRGPMRPPESGTEVFGVDIPPDSADFPHFQSGFPVDTIIGRWNINDAGGGAGPVIVPRLTAGGGLLTYSTAAESTSYYAYALKFDFMNGVDEKGLFSPTTPDLALMFRRAPGFFDVVAYEGDGVDGRAVAHNLASIPELMIVKSRDESASRNWQVYHKDVGYTDRLYLNTDSGLIGSTHWFSEPDSDNFYYTSFATGNASGESYIAYLFATLPGISKVGSYTGNGSSQTIDCGFSSGARFVLVKRVDATGDWHVWDTARGIVSGTEGYLELNTTNAEDTSTDSVDPDGTGFIVNQNSTTDINASGGEYIFLAIA